MEMTTRRTGSMDSCESTCDIDLCPRGPKSRKKSKKSKKNSTWRSYLKLWIALIIILVLIFIIILTLIIATAYIKNAQKDTEGGRMVPLFRPPMFTINDTTNKNE